jgi:Carboxypeptidase regulatory-like domain/TonB-dependent Receptor Plug Domain
VALRTHRGVVRNPCFEVVALGCRLRMHLVKSLRLPLLTFLALCVLGTADAQKAGASLHGFVIVSSGASIPGAAVTVEGSAGGQAATTNAQGEYSMKALGPGDYRVTITAPGYDPFQVEVTLTDGVKREVDGVLTASRLAEPVPQAAPAPSSQTNETPSPPAPAAQPATTAAAPQNVSVTAQKNKAALYGILTDQSGAVVQTGTATVTAAKGAPITVHADVRGQYVLNGLAPGEYHLTLSAPGFADFETSVTLAVSQALEIDATLEPPKSKTEVNVEAGGPAQIETQSAHLEGTITEKEVLKTGLNGRNFTQLIALAPGVSNQTGQDEAKVGVAGSVKYSVNGGRVEYNNFDIDGSDVLNAGLNGAESTLMVYPSLDAIQEVKVLTSNYGAQYGRTASGTVLVTTKQGTAQFHGGGYDFIRNEFFNARNYFDPPGKAPLYRRQDFGFTLGGPLAFRSKKKKTFVFWSEEFRLEKSPLGPGNEPGDFNQAVPTVAERSGNFSDVCPFALPGTQASFFRLAYPDCPAAGQSTAPNQLFTYFGNNLGDTSNIGAPQLNPSSVTLMNALIPPPNSQFGCNSSLVGQVDVQTGTILTPCYVAAISPSTYWREELGRFDHHFTDNLQATFRYIHDAWDTTTPVPQWGYLQTAAIHEQSFPTVENRLNGPGTSLVARLTDTISPSLVNELVVSYVNSNITLKDMSGPGGNVGASVPRGCGSGTCGVGYIFNNGFGGKLPGLVIGGTNGAYGSNGFAVDTAYMPWEHTNPTYGVSDNISKGLGNHTLQFGIQAVEARRSETNGAIGAASGDLQGLLSFSNFSQPGTGNAFANFMNSFTSVFSYQQDSAQLKYYNNYWIVEPYVQDDWRVSRRLTVNLGLRLSLFGNFHELNLNAWNWEQSAFDQTLAATITVDPVAGNLETAKGHNPLPLDPNNPLNGLNPAVTNGLVQCGKNGIPASCASSHIFNPAPRIGFAWDPRGDAKTSIRGGYGIFFEHGTAKEANTGSLEGSSPPVLTMTQLNPGEGYIGIGGNAVSGVGEVFPIDVTSIPTKTIWPYVQQWSLSVQRQLPKDVVATVAYVGSKGTHLSAELQLNQLTPPPTGPDNGIFLSGNPYAPNQPITVQDCNSYSGGSTGSFLVGQFPIGQVTPVPVTVTASEPAWPNLVAACYGLNSQAIPNPNSLRTFAPGMGRVLSLQNVADSQYHALQATIRRTRGPLTVGASYTYSHSFDDSSDRSDASFVNSANLRSSWASSNFDQRHLLSVNYIYTFPKLSQNLARWLSDRGDVGDDDQKAPPPANSSKFLRTLLDGWEYSGITVFQSGTPFSVINSGGNTGVSVLDNGGVANGSGAGSYPDVIGNPRSRISTTLAASGVGPLLYNPEAFAAPQGLTFGNAGRNFLNNPHRLNFDMTLLKNFKVTEGSTMEFRLEAFNIFNHTEFRIFNPNNGNTASNTIGCYGGPLDSAAGGSTPVPGAPLGTPPINVNCTTGSAFLRPVDSHRPRTIQLGLKYQF